MDEKLKPCPLCAGEAFLISTVKITQQSSFAVRCRDCLLETPSYMDSQHIMDMWNTRADEAKAVSEDKAVAKAIAAIHGYFTEGGLDKSELWFGDDLGHDRRAIKRAFLAAGVISKEGK